MRSLWRLTAFFFVAGQLYAAQADSLCVVTWNLHLFPSGSFSLKRPETEGATVSKAAAVLRKALPHIILLQEIRDSASAVALIDSIDTLDYRVAVCSAFRDRSGIPTFQQVAIITRLPAQNACWKNWATTGPVDPPRGFAYARITFQNKPISVYCLHLKSNWIGDNPNESRENQLNILKRELSMDQLRRQLDREPYRKGEIRRTIVGGDMNTNQDNIRFLSERSLALLDSMGFVSCFAGIPPDLRITCPGKGRYPDATFDYIYAIGLRFLAPPRILQSRISDHGAVICILEITR